MKCIHCTEGTVEVPAGRAHGYCDTCGTHSTSKFNPNRKINPNTHPDAVLEVDPPAEPEEPEED